MNREALRRFGWVEWLVILGVIVAVLSFTQQMALAPGGVSKIIVPPSSMPNGSPYP